MSDIRQEAFQFIQNCSVGLRVRPLQSFTYKCDDQVFTYIWTYSIHQVFKINLPKTKTMGIGPINIIHTANSFTQMFSKNCHFSINSISLSPILVNIKDKLLRSKPIKWLGRICMPKINIIPRLRYPLKMLSVTGNCFVSKEKIFPTRQALLWFPPPCTQWGFPGDLPLEQSCDTSLHIFDQMRAIHSQLGALTSSGYLKRDSVGYYFICSGKLYNTIPRSRLLSTQCCGGTLNYLLSQNMSKTLHLSYRHSANLMKCCRFNRLTPAN